MGASQTVTLNAPKTTSSAVSNGVSITDILSSSSEDVKDFKILQASVSSSAEAPTSYSPNNVPVSFPGLIPSTEVKRESVQTVASQDGGSVVTFTAPVQINQYGIVQIPNSGTNGQLLNGSIGFSPLQLPPVSVAASQGKPFLCYTQDFGGKQWRALRLSKRRGRAALWQQPGGVHKMIHCPFIITPLCNTHYAQFSGVRLCLLNFFLFYTLK